MSRKAAELSIEVSTLPHVIQGDIMVHEGYHRIETAEMGLNPKGQDTEYYLARLEGQLFRLEGLIESGLTYDNMTETRSILTNSKSFLSLLRKSLDGNRLDVA